MIHIIGEKKKTQMMERKMENPKETHKRSKTTPFVFRVVVLALYMYVAICGLKLLYDGFDFEFATDSVSAFTILYAVEFLWSLYPGWISMYGVNMKHMWEHHFPGMLLGFALIYHFQFSDPAAPSFMDHAKFPFAVGLSTQFCESFFVFRTFSSEPRNWHFRVIQRMLGFFWVLALSLSVQYSAFLWCKARYHETSESSSFQFVEFVVVPVSLYLGFWIHPQYIKKHVNKLRGLIRERKESKNGRRKSSSGSSILLSEKKML
jgi:hypothetical protein